MDTTTDSSHSYNEESEEGVKHINHLEQGSPHVHLPAESLIREERLGFTNSTQSYQSIICQQAKEDATRPVFESNPYSTAPSVSSLSVPDDSNQNGAGNVKSVDEQQVHCQPQIQSGIEAVVEMLLENSRHLPGFTQIIEQATPNNNGDVGIKEDTYTNGIQLNTLVESTTQGNEQKLLPKKQLGSSSAQTNDSGNAPASGEAQRLLDTLCTQTSENQGACNVKQQDLVKRHKCPECDKLFPRASSLKRHIVLHMDDRPYQCTECEANYKSYSQLKRHLRIHTGEKPAKCEHCEKTFRTYNELYVHRRSHTGEKPFECKFCGKCFSTRGYRNTHERIHTGEKRFKCDICGMKFTESSARRVHRFTHTGETPYKCEVCGRGFTQAGNLSKHVKTLHSKVKPFKCQECGKDFAVKQELTRHFSRVHSSDKPHQCKHCGKKYAIHSDLTQHMRTHKNRCSNCGTKFKNGEELQRHIMENCIISATATPADSERIEGHNIDNGEQKSIQCVHSKLDNVGHKRERKHSAVRDAPSSKKLKSLPSVNIQLSSKSEIVGQESLTEEPYNDEF